jgi:hypothetical protein
MSKKSGSGSGMIKPDQISESLETIDFNSFMQIRDPGWKKIRIRDGENSDPGSWME